MKFRISYVVNDLDQVVEIVSDIDFDPKYFEEIMEHPDYTNLIDSFENNYWTIDHGGDDDYCDLDFPDGCDSVQGSDEFYKDNFDKMGEQLLKDIEEVVKRVIAEN